MPVFCDISDVRFACNSLYIRDERPDGIQKYDLRWERACSAQWCTLTHAFLNQRLRQVRRDRADVVLVFASQGAELVSTAKVASAQLALHQVNTLRASIANIVL